MTNLNPLENELEKAEAELATRELARRRLNDFCNYTDDTYLESWHTEIVCEALEKVEKGEIRYLIIEAPPRHPLELKTEVPTPKGWTTIGEIAVGEFVYGSDGEQVRVTGKSEVFKNRTLYRVKTDEEESIVVDGEHLWTVRLDRKHKYIKTYTTEFLYERQTRMTDFRKPAIKHIQATKNAEKKLLIEPYLLGAWLGDGTGRSGAITSNKKNGDYKRMKEKIEGFGYKITDYKNDQTFHVWGLRKKLASLGVLTLVGSSAKNKHIPKEYLRSSIEQRMELLRGLMDTDGNVGKDGQSFYNTTSEKLRDGVVELVRSLGVKATIINCRATLYGRYIGSYWRISFYLSGCVTLPRKLERTRNAKRTTEHFVFIEKIGVGDTQCISVDSGDSLFAVGRSWLLTHNSKSYHVAQRFPAWAVGRDKDTDIIVASYSGDLATDHGRETRNLIATRKYQNIFSTTLAEDSKAKGKWNTNGRGSYNAVGVGGSTTGKGADFFIIDDAFKDRKESDSALIRDERWKWYRSVALTRLSPKGAVVLTGTRWHEQDLIGRLTEGEDREDFVSYWDYLKGARAKWVRLTLKAIAEEDEPHRKKGEALWEERYPLTEILEKKKSLGIYEFASLYQAHPVDIENRTFKKEWLKYRTMADVEKMRKRLFITIDPNLKKADDSDYCGVVRNYVNERNEWTLRASRYRVDSQELINLIFLVHDEGAEKIGIEEGAFTYVIAPFLKDEMKKRGKFPNVQPLKHGGRMKETRIEGLVPWYANGKIFHIKDECNDLEEELLSFPRGTFDDVIDSLSYQIGFCSPVQSTRMMRSSTITKTQIAL